MSVYAFARTASTYAVTSPGRSSIGPYKVRIFLNRGPLIARSQPSPACDRKIVSCHFSKLGRQRRMADSTAARSRERAEASVSCGQITLTGIQPHTLPALPLRAQAKLYLSEGLRPSDSPTRSLARRFAGALRSRGSFAALARVVGIGGNGMDRLTRRDLFRASALLAAPALLRPEAAEAAGAGEPAQPQGRNVYE